MRLIDADVLMLYLNDIYFRNSPNGNSWRETLEMKQYREGVCEGLEMAMKSVEEAPTVGGWISVKDRMPEKDKDVLVWLYGDYCIGRYDQDPDNLQMRWKFEAFNLYEDDMSYITHWMPLPEPPEKEK